MKKLHTSMKKDKWVAYNILYEDGKQMGAPYKAGVGKTKAEVKKQVTKYNNTWNKNSGQGRYVAKLSKIKPLHNKTSVLDIRVKTYKKRKSYDIIDNLI